MHIFLSSVFLFFSCAFFSQVPGFSWAKQMGGVSSDVGISVCVDVSGNVYTTGTFRGSVDFDPGPGVAIMNGGSLDDVFISKLDASGNFVWAKQIAGIGTDGGNEIKVDGLGNIYLTGYFDSIADLDPGPGTFTVSALGNYEIFVLKLDASGNFSWAAHFNNINYNTFIHQGVSIDVDNAGNVYTIGNFEDTTDFDPGPGVFNLWPVSPSDVFICKLNSFGSFVWAKSFGSGSVDQGRAIQVDALGNVYTTGVFGGFADFDPGPGVYNMSTNAGSLDIFISKLNSAGNFIWARSIGGKGSDGSNSMEVDASGNVYVTGAFVDTLDMDPGVGTATVASASFNDMFILKLDSSGNYIWGKATSGTFVMAGYEVRIDASNNVYASGSFGGTVDFDPGPATYSLTSTNADAFVIKLNTLGNFLWVAQFSGSSGEDAYSVAINGQDIYLTGSFGNAPTDFDPGSGTYTMSSIGGTDVFVCKLDQSITTSIAESGSKSKLFIYPNPTASSINLTATEDISNSEIEVINVLGECVMKIPFSNSIDISSLSNGVYTAKVTLRDKFSTSSKFIKQ